MSKQGWAVDPIMQLDSFDMIINLVSLGMGVSFVPVRALALYSRKKNLKRIKLPVRFVRELTVVIRHHRKMPDHFTPIHRKHLVFNQTALAAFTLFRRHGTSSIFMKFARSLSHWSSLQSSLSSLSHAPIFLPRYSRSGFLPPRSSPRTAFGRLRSMKTRLQDHGIAFLRPPKRTNSRT